MSILSAHEPNQVQSYIICFYQRNLIRLLWEHIAYRSRLEIHPILTFRTYKLISQTPDVKELLYAASTQACMMIPRQEILLAIDSSSLTMCDYFLGHTNLQYVLHIMQTTAKGLFFLFLFLVCSPTVSPLSTNESTISPMHSMPSQNECTACTNDCFRLSAVGKLHRAGNPTSLVLEWLLLERDIFDMFGVIATHYC